MNHIAHDWLPWAVMATGFFFGALVLLHLRGTSYQLTKSLIETNRNLSRENAILTMRAEGGTPFYPWSPMHQPHRPHDEPNQDALNEDFERPDLGVPI